MFFDGAKVNIWTCSLNINNADFLISVPVCDFVIFLGGT